MKLLRALPVPLTLIVMIGLSGAALGRIYADQLLVQVVAGAAVASVGVSLAMRRLPSWLVAPVSVLAMAGYATGALWVAAHRVDLPGDLTTVIGEAARNGIPRLLTAMIPVESAPDTIVVPVVAAWLAGLAGAELAIRAGGVLTGYLPPTALYAGALYVVGPNADSELWPTLAFAAAAVLGLATTGKPAIAATDGPERQLVAGLRPMIRTRLIAGTAAGAIAVVGFTLAVAPAVTSRVGTAPVDPRQYVQPPHVDSLDDNPLIRISGWALNPEQKLFEVHRIHTDSRRPDTSDDPADPTPPDAANPEVDGVRFRLAVLSDYDGITWRVGATYRSAGRVLPPADLRPDAAVDTISQQITIADLSGRLLPAVPTPQQVQGVRVAYDPETGTLIHPEGLLPGLRYTVTSAHERPDVNRLTTANVPAGEAVARMLQVGDTVPEQMRRLAQELATDNSAPYARAIAIEQFLAEHYRMVSDAPSGHAYPNLNFFLFGPRDAGGQRGTSEQFAAAFAVLGRLMGLPTRVVVGFHATAGAAQVRGADAYAWPEVLFDELGWIAFDPLPQPDTEPRPVEEDFRPKPQKSVPPPTPEPTPTAAPTATATATDAAATPVPGGRSLLTMVSGMAATTLLTLAGFAAAVALLRRRQRRRRLGAGSAARRIAGAWWEITDALRLCGWPVAGHLSATEVAGHARAVAEGLNVRSPGIDELATLVNLAAFAPGEVNAEQGQQAGKQAMAYTSALRAGHPWWRRIVWSCHPGPLWWRR